MARKKPDPPKPAGATTPFLIRLTVVDKEGLDAIRADTGVNSQAAAVRYAIRFTAKSMTR